MDSPSPADSAPPAPAPSRELGTLDATLVVTGSIIGSGIFFVSGGVAEHCSSNAAFLGVWLLGGVIALAGALCSGELGGMFPRGGGEYVYLREAYGPAAGFLSGWTSFWIGFPGSIATLAYGFARAVGSLVHADGHGFELAVALASVVVLTGVNAFGLRAGKWVQNALSGAKLVALAAILVAGFLTKPDATAAAAPFFDGDGHASSIAVALVPVMFAYLGWNAATYLAGEIREPRRSLGNALVIGTAVSTAIYLAINATYLRALTLGEMRTEKTVAAAALGRLLGGAMTSALTVVIAVAILSSLQATIITGPRICQAMAEDGIFFERLRRLHPATRVPVAGILAQGAIACALLVVGAFDALLTFTTFAIMLFATLTAGAVYVLRMRRPDLPRAFRVTGYPVTPALFVAANVWLMWNVLAFGAKEAVIGLAIVATGVPAYAAFRRWGARQTG